MQKKKNKKGTAADMLDFVNLQPAFNPYCQTEIIYINDMEHSLGKLVVLLIVVLRIVNRIVYNILL